jgi:hypothetical protein
MQIERQSKGACQRVGTLGQPLASLLAKGSQRQSKGASQVLMIRTNHMLLA